MTKEEHIEVLEHALERLQGTGMPELDVEVQEAIDDLKGDAKAAPKQVPHVAPHVAHKK